MHLFFCLKNLLKLQFYPTFSSMRHVRKKLPLMLTAQVSLTIIHGINYGEMEFLENLKKRRNPGARESLLHLL